MRLVNENERATTNMKNSKDTKSLTEEAYRNIKRLMLQQKLIPGQKLPYRELTGQLNMSKTPIISALNRLEQDGFVASETNCGYYVKPIDEKEIQDACEVREALELKAAQLAVRLLKPDDMALLEEKLLAYEQYVPHVYDKKKFMLNAEFHLQVASVSGNRVLKYLLRKNLEHTLLRARLDNLEPDEMSHSASEHKKLLEGLKRKDMLKCTDLIQKHIQRTRDALIRGMSMEDIDGLESISFFEE